MKSTEETKHTLREIGEWERQEGRGMLLLVTKQKDPLTLVKPTTIPLSFAHQYISQKHKQNFATNVKV